ncbi:MAG: hypothetical protein SGILL_001360 [Bacillariaceae sp.]
MTTPTQQQRQPQPTHWLPNNNDKNSDTGVDALCLGTGRFLRSVLVPSLVGAGLQTALVQPRGRSFLEYMASRDGETYPIDTVLEDGTIRTEEIPCCGAFSLGSEADKESLVEWLPTLKHNPLVLGIGVTEAGLASHETQAMKDLYELLLLFLILINEGKWKVRERICVINMDNVPNNGDVIQRFLLRISDERLHSETETSIHRDMRVFLIGDRIVFLNSMVDRITSQREGSNGKFVPRCEPMPMKALVLLDLNDALPPRLKDQTGVIVRKSERQLEKDIDLKLRIANGTHTAIAHVLTLRQHFQTTILATHKPGRLYMEYLESIISHQIIPAVTASSRATAEETQEVWQDWRTRLVHPHFGLSTLFISQNGATKGGIRWGPTVDDILTHRAEDDTSPIEITVAMAFAYAALLRFLTPILKNPVDSVFKGWFVAFDPDVAGAHFRNDKDSTEYAQGLCCNAKSGWYDFSCSMNVCKPNGVSVLLPSLLFECRGKQPIGCIDTVKSYLLSEQGGNLRSVSSNPKFESLVKAIATLYARMLVGDGMEKILGELSAIGLERGCGVLADGTMKICDTSNARFASGIPLRYQVSAIPDDSNVMNLPLDLNSIRATIFAEVAAAEVIDLHTHILPPTHGALCLWGIDELLTYHYLVAEYFMTAEASVSPEGFYAMSTQEQAGIIWKALFIDRSPVSEACRGVITTLNSLGLHDKVAHRDLQGIRDYFLSFQKLGEAGAADFCENVFQISGVRYAIMTNIPFSQAEAQYWRGPNKQAYSNRFRSALRVDPLLAGDTKAIEAALKGSGYVVSLAGARQYLRDWIDTMKPEYLMASTPHDFVFEEGSLGGVAKKGSVNKEALHDPFAFVKASQQTDTCNGTEDDTPSIVNENSDFLGEVLMKVCEERDLPVALKIGAHRGVNPRLKDAGDGVVAFADAGMLGRLCTKFPNVRFLATFLSRSNQHEAVVLATKFRNLHLYGCWWFCNNPSIIREITSMRIEMLGTAFTAQHSDARVVDQLLYKWPHSRGVIASVLAGEVEKLLISGWIPTRREIRRDVQRLFGRSYEEFMDKSFAK